MRLLFPLASVTNLAAISLERMHATFRPFKHCVIKNWVLGVVVTVTWVTYTAGLLSTAVALMSGNGLHVYSDFGIFNNVAVIVVLLFRFYSNDTIMSFQSFGV